MWWRIAIVHTVHLQLIKSNRCFKCLKTGHQVKENQDSEKEIPENSRKKKSSSVTGSAVTTTSAIKTKGDILLHANRHSYSDKRRKHKVNRKTRISFDNGSQRSYITDSVKAKLSFKPTSYETLHLNTFLEKVYQKKKMPSRNFNLPLRSGKNECVKISALSFPVICSPHPPNRYQGISTFERFTFCRQQDRLAFLLARINTGTLSLAILSVDKVAPPP